ncbi:MAG: glycosyltransferase [Vicinamibacterales bacterium]
MQVCHVSPHLPPDQAANALLPAELGRWTHARGMSVSFVTQPPTQGGPVADSLPGPVYRVAPRSASRFARVTRVDTFRRARAIARALDQAAAGADLLHLHSNGLIVEVAADWARRHRRPYVLTLYGTEIWHYRKRWPLDPFTRAYQRASEVTFYSEGLLSRARELGLERQALSVVYPAVNTSFARLDDQARQALRVALGVHEPRLILNVKRLHELAGQQYLIGAFARIARQRDDVRLVICGTGPLEAQLRAQAQAAGLAGRVTFTGLITNAEVARFAAAADVFALPSLLEALPTVAVEALAAGTPVVSADHPGGIELQQLFGEDVVVVPRRDEDALAHALGARLDIPRRARPETAEIIVQRFSPDAVRAAYEAVYDRALPRSVLAGRTGA